MKVGGSISAALHGLSQAHKTRAVTTPGTGAPFQALSMKSVSQHILRRKRDYTRLPFFDFLRDNGLSPRQRLSFFPCMMPFILSFGDPNRHVMRTEPTDDSYLKMINAHTYEDDHH